MAKNPRPPGGLKKEGKEFWKRVLKEYEIREAHDLERLRMAGGCLDEIAEGQEVLKTTGRYIPDRYGGLRENPAAKAIRESKIIFCRIIRELGLDLEGAQESRPPRQY